MKNVFGDDSKEQPIGRLVVALSKAEDIVSRLDERARSPLGEGLCARLAFHEACAWSWNRGEVVHLEDLVLHDHELDLRAPDQELTRTHAALRIWRRSGRVRPSQLLGPDNVQRLINPRRVVRSRSVADLFSAADAKTGLLADDVFDVDSEDAETEIDALLLKAAAITTDDNDDAVVQWFAFERAVPQWWPPLLRAAVLLEAWTGVDPLPMQSYLGGVIANAVLMHSGRLLSHRLHVELGRRRRARDVRRPDRQSGLRRVIWQLQAIAAGEAFALEEYERIELARQVVSLGLAGRRSTSRLAELIELFTEVPVLTAPLIAGRLKVSQQAARGLVAQMGASVIEISGRRRYQAWRL